MIGDSIGLVVVLGSVDGPSEELPVNLWPPFDWVDVDGWDIGVITYFGFDGINFVWSLVDLLLRKLALLIALKCNSDIPLAFDVDGSGVWSILLA